jgi:hypothetical protein
MTDRPSKYPFAEQGNRLRILRKAENMANGSMFAARLDWPQSAYSQFETGMRQIPLGKVQAMVARSQASIRSGYGAGTSAGSVGRSGSASRRSSSPKPATMAGTAGTVTLTGTTEGQDVSRSRRFFGIKRTLGQEVVHEIVQRDQHQPRVFRILRKLSGHN